MAIATKVTTKWEGQKVVKRMEQATFKSIAHVAASLRLVAKRSIKRSKKPSAPGTPVHTKTTRLPRAIVFFVDRKRFYAVIGPSRELIGTVGSAHEFGGEFRGQHYPKRSFMEPAMEKTTPRLPRQWAASFRG